MARKRSTRLGVNRTVSGSGRHPFDIMGFQGDAVCLVVSEPVTIVTRYGCVRGHEPNLIFPVRVGDQIQLGSQTFCVQAINPMTQEVTIGKVALRKAM